VASLYLADGQTTNSFLTAYPYQPPAEISKLPVETSELPVEPMVYKLPDGRCDWKFVLVQQCNAFCEYSGLCA